MGAQTPAPLGPLAQEAGEVKGDEMKPIAKRKIARNTGQGVKQDRRGFPAFQERCSVKTGRWFDSGTSQ